MTIEDLKIYSINGITLGISMTSLDTILKIFLLAASLGYTLQKWYLMNKKDKNTKT